MMKHNLKIQVIVFLSPTKLSKNQLQSLEVTDSALTSSFLVHLQLKVEKSANMHV